MKHRTEGVTELILEAAQKEFLVYGYMNASLRRIARNCNVSTHTIYTRFEDKYGLFIALVNDKANELKRIHLESLNSTSNNSSFDEQELVANNGTNKVLKYIYDNYEIFKIIICKSAGTKFEHYLDELAETEEHYYKNFIKTINGETKEISDFFIHAICSGGFRPIYEVVSHDLSYADAKEFLKLQVYYNFGGWKAVLNKKI